MREIIINIIEKLFDKIPFSRQEEELKAKVQSRLLQQFEEEATSENEIAKAGELIQSCNNLESACQAAGESVPNLDQYMNTEGLLGKGSAKKLLSKIKRHLYVECFCLVNLVYLIISTICNFSTWNLAWNSAFVALWLGIAYFVNCRKKQYQEKCNYKALRYDQSGRTYLYQQEDRYAKKFINTSMFGVCVLAYLSFSILLSVFSSKYTLTDVYGLISYMSIVLEVALFLHLKNIFCKRTLDTYFVDERHTRYKSQLLRISGISGVYFVACIVALVLLRSHIDNIYNAAKIITLIYAAGCLFYNMTTRKSLVFQNVVVNVRRIVCVSLIVSIAFTYNVMSMDLYLTQPYINTVSRLLEVEDEIDYNDDTGMYTITTDKENFKILQLTDIHLGGSTVSMYKDLRALQACYDLIKYARPDLVVVTGDLVFPMGVMSFSLNNSAPIMQFANFMRNTGIPWAFTYGNHDTESMATLNISEFDSLMKSLSFKSSGNLLYPYVQPDIYGRSNQIIEIRNTDGALMQDLFLIDSNDYLEGSKTINEYDYIHDDQVAWYKKNVLALSEQEGYTIPSMIFFHIPLREYKEANELYESGSDEVKYHYGILGEKMIDKICCSKYESKLFNTAVELGSTKAMFCGHDHYNNQSLEYKGIRLTYGYSIDYLVMPGIDEDTEQRGATLITVDRNGDFEINPYRLMDIATP